MSPSLALPIAVNVQHDWAALSKIERQNAWRAASKLVTSLQALAERGEQVVQAIIANREIIEWEHYPDNDVRDERNASQYFYHCHTGLQRPFTEHGHFHLFVHPEKLGLRASGKSVSPAHLVAISMDAQGIPSGFFAVNRWVTQGPWLSYVQCEKALAHFQIKGRHGKKEINHFLRALLSLYQQPILQLLQCRDQVMAQQCQGRDRRSVFADKQIEVLCYLPIQLMDDIAQLEAAM